MDKKLFGLWNKYIINNDTFGMECAHYILNLYAPFSTRILRYKYETEAGIIAQKVSQTWIELY